MNKFTTKPVPMGIRDLAGVIHGIWEDKYIKESIKLLMDHCIENNFDLTVLFSDPVPLNHNLVNTSSR